MAIAKITEQGLTAIAIMVALLWGCLLSERLIVKHANSEVTRTIREIRLMQLRRRSQPVSVPAPRSPRPVRPALG